MEEIVNIPIQMISVCSTVGDLTPLRFRFENNEHSVETIDVNSVHSYQDTKFNGIKEIQYVCSAFINDTEKLFILKYNVNSHKWIMFKMLN